MPYPAGQHGTLTLWRITDHRAGHDKQSLGLCKALAGIVNCKIIELSAPSILSCLANVLRPGYSFAADLPDPDIIIGAGHKTHIPLICAAYSRGGKTVVLMQPSLPNAWFDLCFIPEHDAPRPAENICLTKGALNPVQPSKTLDPAQGTILVGGPSRHHHWNEHQLLEQIKEITADPEIHWSISDSPRTPAATRQKLAGLKQANIQFHPFGELQHGWLEGRLAISGTTWVTEDSISMIYEALTCGSAVGLLSVPVKQQGRVVSALQALSAAGDVTLFSDWKKGKGLTPASPPLAEAVRCARLLLERFKPI